MSCFSVWISILSSYIINTNLKVCRWRSTFRYFKYSVNAVWHIFFRQQLLEPLGLHVWPEGQHLNAVVKKNGFEMELVTELEQWSDFHFALVFLRKRSHSFPPKFFFPIIDFTIGIWLFCIVLPQRKIFLCPFSFRCFVVSGKTFSIDLDLFLASAFLLWTEQSLPDLSCKAVKGHRHSE